MKPEHVDDVSLALAVTAGSRGAKVELVRRYEGVVRRQLTRQYRIAPDVADDLTQAVLLEALTSLGRYRGDASLRTWLGRLTRSHAFNYFRREHRRLQHTQELVDRPQGSAMREHSLREQCRLLVSSLSPAERELVLMRYAEERTLEELATRVGRTKEVIRKRLRRAAAKLRQQ
ncbi:MAG: sigma-70 family RNA polymerase sigma factor [Nannocystaceae bacterium]